MFLQKDQILDKKNCQQIKLIQTFIDQQQEKFSKGIPIGLVQNSKVQIQHLTCSICQNVLWKPITCNQSNCYANYCQQCLSASVKKSEASLKQYQSKLKNLHNSQNQENTLINCQKCKRQIQKTHFPLINNLLSNITFKCLFLQSGCKSIINYEHYLKHLLNCDYKKITCLGCKHSFLKKQIQQHNKICQSIQKVCTKCKLRLPQKQFKQHHTQIKCLEQQLQAKNKKLEKVQNKVMILQHKLNQYEILIDKVVKGQSIKLKIDFHTSFPSNFAINKNEVRLHKSSWNSTKDRYDFLHFYLTQMIKTDGVVGYQWKIVIKDLKGNLLIGICSSLGPNSVDYVINKYGEIKKKTINQNKYRLIRKSQFKFNQKDVITFKYLSIKKKLKIINQTQNMQCLFQKKEVEDLGESIYTFYSLDTWGDSLKFL